jgi:hypothetical protein
MWVSVKKMLIKLFTFALGLVLEVGSGMTGMVRS